METIESMPAEALALVSTLAGEIRSRVETISALELQLKTEKNALLALETQRLPDAMSDLGFTTVRLTDGSTIDGGPEFHCSITKDKKPEALAWLRENNYGDLIKCSVWVEFGKGQEQEAAALFNELQQQHPEQPVGIDEGVHPATLKSLVKEQHESGTPLPEELFGIYIITRATIKSPKLNTKSRK
jgi:hypothetical protein